MDIKKIETEAVLNALRRLAVARHKAEQARKAFCGAWEACSDENGRLFHRVRADDGAERGPLYVPGDEYIWVYTKGRQNAGQDATDDPLWKQQNQAWHAMKAANRELSIAKAQVTRISNRIAFPFGVPK